MSNYMNDFDLIEQLYKDAEHGICTNTIIEEPLQPKDYNSDYNNPNPNSDGLKNLRGKFNTKPQNMGEIYTACKYLLPCGKCEMTKELCTYIDINIG